jgi:hypothetical protein
MSLIESLDEVDHVVLVFYFESLINSLSKHVFFFHLSSVLFFLDFIVVLMII